MYKILIKYLNKSEELYQLSKATTGSAGFDLLASINDPVEINPGKSILIPCGFSLQMPSNIEAQVRPRSGLALKNSITVLNSPGTIDSDYRGEICVILINHGLNTFSISRGMRVAQVIFKELPEIKLVEVEKLQETDRGSGGFGSTGV